MFSELKRCLVVGCLQLEPTVPEGNMQNGAVSTSDFSWQSHSEHHSLVQKARTVGHGGGLVATLASIERKGAEGDESGCSAHFLISIHPNPSPWDGAAYIRGDSSHFLIVI